MMERSRCTNVLKQNRRSDDLREYFLQDNDLKFNRIYGQPDLHKGKNTASATLKNYCIIKRVPDSSSRRIIATGDVGLQLVNADGHC